MAIRKDIYALIPGVTKLESINISESYGQTSAVATILCGQSLVALNDPITIDLGYSDNHAVVFQGRVKNVERSRAEGLIKLTCRDILVDASDYFMASGDPETPWSRTNIKAQDAVGDLLAEAGITNYAANVPLEFVYATHAEAPLEFNMISVMDAITQICQTLVWHVYADGDTVRFTDIKPYYRSGHDKDVEYGQTGNTGDTISHHICTDGTLAYPDTKKIIKNLDYVYTDENLRNRVVVYGREGINADAYVSSPYLPPGFYKTAVIASPLIDDGDMADATANFNLALYNRLTETLSLECLGDPTIAARQFAEVADSLTGVSGYWFIETVNHVVGKDGFVTRLGLKK